jgi:hypothetical protein
VFNELLSTQPALFESGIPTPNPRTIAGGAALTSDAVTVPAVERVYVRETALPAYRMLENVSVVGDVAVVDGAVVLELPQPSLDAASKRHAKTAATFRLVLMGERCGR